MICLYQKNHPFKKLKLALHFDDEFLTPGGSYQHRRCAGIFRQNGRHLWHKLRFRGLRGTQVVPFKMYPPVNQHGWPENGPVEDLFPIENGIFQPAMLVYWSVIPVTYNTKTQKKKKTHQKHDVFWLKVLKMCLKTWDSWKWYSKNLTSQNSPIRTALFSMMGTMSSPSPGTPRPRNWGCQDPKIPWHSNYTSWFIGILTVGYCDPLYNVCICVYVYQPTKAFITAQFLLN